MIELLVALCTVQSVLPVSGTAMSFQPPSNLKSNSRDDQSKDLPVAFMVRIDKITMEDTIPLRHSVLWPTKPPSHVCLPEDATGTHYGAFLPLRETPVAVISLFLEDLPLLRDGQGDEDIYRPAQQRAVRFRKFACELEFQGKGIGTQLLQYVLSRARTELDAATVWCDARVTACGWYIKRGLVPFGPTFYKGPEECCAAGKVHYFDNSLAVLQVVKEKDFGVSSKTRRHRVIIVTGTLHGRGDNIRRELDTVGWSP